MHLRGAHCERVLGTRGVGTYKKEGKAASFFLHSLVYDASLRRRARVDPRSCHSHATLFSWTTYLYVVVVADDTVVRSALPTAFGSTFASLVGAKCPPSRMNLVRQQ